MFKLTFLEIKIRLLLNKKKKRVLCLNFFRTSIDCFDTKCFCTAGNMRQGLILSFFVKN